MNLLISSFLLPISCFIVCTKNGEHSVVQRSIVQYVHKCYSSFLVKWIIVVTSTMISNSIGHRLDL